MTDNRINNGGHHKGGRKSKAEEQKLVEKLTPLAEKAYKALELGLEEGQSWAAKLFFEYMYGKPKQTIDQNTTLEITDFDISKLYDRET